MFIGQINRIVEIYLVFMRNVLDIEIKNFSNLWLLHFFRIFFPSIWFRNSKKSRAVRLRETFESLGPIFIKFGQTISTRKDLLPPDISEELSKLQDRVPPFEGEIAKKTIEESLNIKINDVFDSFDLTPLASASIAQVHSARLNNKDVIIKVLRPEIEKQIDKDLKLLYFIAKIVSKAWKGSKRFKPIEIVDEYEKVIHAELDLLREASNASLLKRNFENSNYLYVPEIYWDYTTENVMVMERIFGINISHKDLLIKNKINIQKLSEKGVKIFFTQVFQHNFFHADMHPGNIFVSTENPDDPTYCAVDFGIMGSLSEEDQRYLALNFLAFFERDYRRVAQLHIDSKWVGEGTRLEEFEAAIRSVCEPIFEKPLKEISFGNLLLRLFSVARQFNMEVQPQLVLLQKTLLNIEGLGRDLYPDLDLWATAKPFFEKWAKDNMSLKATIKKLVKEAPVIYNDLSNIPKLIKQIGDYENQNKMIEKNIILNSENKSKKAQINLLLLINIILILFIALYVI
tara:strand:+ start:5674 stop:7218 length:1545 start_codon:yes stop_codon:yes gene_type:complete